MVLAGCLHSFTVWEAETGNFLSSRSMAETFATGLQRKAKSMLLEEAQQLLGPVAAMIHT